MSAVLKMSDQMTLPGMTDCTSLPGLPSGITHSIRPAGGDARYGPAPVRANLSARQAKALGLLTSGTYGRTSTGSSSSAALGSALASRLQVKTALLGSTLYKLTWRERATPAGHLIPALRASVLRTSDSGSTGSPCEGSDGRSRLDQLPRQAAPAGWPTCTAQDAVRGAKEARPWDTGKPLNQIAALAGWPTPKANDDKMARRSTEAAHRFMERPQRSSELGIEAHQVVHGQPARLTASGQMLTGSDAGMESGGQLNPAHSRWLMGLPPEWDACAVTAMQSMPSKRQRSSKQ